MLLLRSFLICLLLSSSCFAQLEVVVSQATAIESVTTVETKSTVTVSKYVGVDGQLIMPERETPGTTETSTKVVPVERAVALLKISVDLPISETAVKIRCDTATPKKIDKTTYLIDELGTHEVQAIAVHASSDDWQFKTITITIGEIPTPEPVVPDPVEPDEPDPTPPQPDFPDDGEFAGLAAAAYEKSRNYEGRLQLAAILDDAAAKMQTFHFRSTEDVSAYIAGSRPTCDAIFCPWFYKDASARAPLSWQQTIDYYRTVAMGLKR